MLFCCFIGTGPVDVSMKRESGMNWSHTDILNKGTIVTRPLYVLAIIWCLEFDARLYS